MEIGGLLIGTPNEDFAQPACRIETFHVLRFSLSCAAGLPCSATTPSTAVMDVKDSELRLVAGAGYAKCMAPRSKDEHFARFQQKHSYGREPDYTPMRLNASEFRLPDIHGTSPANDTYGAEVCESVSSPAPFAGGATVRA